MREPGRLAILNRKAARAPKVYPADPLTFARDFLHFHPDEHQQPIFDPTIRRGVLNCTRQFGKSTCIAALVTHHAVTQPDSTTLILAPVHTQSGEFMNKVRSFLHTLGLHCRAAHAHPGSVLLPNGSRILPITGRDLSVRSYKSSLVIIDEAARVEDAAIAGITPTLATTNGTLWMLSTPEGRTGEFHRAWTSGDPAFFRLRVTADQCPRISKEFLALERSQKTERQFRQEYYGEFADSNDAVFNTALLDNCIVKPNERSSVIFAKRNFLVGVDFGQMRDPSAIVILESAWVSYAQFDYIRHMHQQGLEYTVRHVERIPLHTPYAQVISRLKAIVMSPPYQDHSTIVVDASGVGRPVFEEVKAQHMARTVIGLNITSGDSANGTNVPKRDLIATLQVMVEQRELRFPAELANLDQLLQEFRCMRGLPTPSGNIRYEAAPGESDDLVMALSLAAWQARPGGPYAGERSTRLL